MGKLEFIPLVPAGRLCFDWRDLKKYYEAPDPDGVGEGVVPYTVTLYANPFTGDGRCNHPSIVGSDGASRRPWTR